MSNSWVFQNSWDCFQLVLVSSWLLGILTYTKTCSVERFPQSNTVVFHLFQKLRAEITLLACQLVMLFPPLLTMHHSFELTTSAPKRRFLLPFSSVTKKKVSKKKHRSPFCECFTSQVATNCPSHSGASNDYLAIPGFFSLHCSLWWMNILWSWSCLSPRQFKQFLSFVIESLALWILLVLFPLVLSVLWSGSGLCLMWFLLWFFNRFEIFLHGFCIACGGQFCLLDAIFECSSVKFEPILHAAATASLPWSVLCGRNECGLNLMEHTASC